MPRIQPRALCMLRTQPDPNPCVRSSNRSSWTWTAADLRRCEEGRKSHSQTLNMDLSLPDRGRLLGLESTHKARGPGAKARHRRRSLFVEPDPRVEQTSFARGAYVMTRFSSASRSASVAERPDIPARSPSLGAGHTSARRSHHDLTNRRRIENP